MLDFLDGLIEVLATLIVSGGLLLLHLWAFWSQ